MHYILTQMPDGLRGLVTVGAIAAALSSTNSVLGAMSSVFIEDIYRPWKSQRAQMSELHYLKAARYAILFFALILSLMAMVSYYWQHYSDLSLVSFALGVMAFAYTGLLGVFFSAIFTRGGNAKTLPLALVGGFLTVLALQPYTFGVSIGFSWQILIGTLISFIIMQLGKSHE